MTVDIAAIGQSIDSTWGRSSTPKTASYSVKMIMHGPETLHVSFAMVVNFSTERQMIEVKRSSFEEAGSIINEVLKGVKANYKDLTGNALKATEIKGSSTDSLEIINMNAHNSHRTCYYRRKVMFEVS
jgi:hypothetical protein